MTINRRPGWKSGGGCMGVRIERADRDSVGRVPLTVRQREVVQAIRDHIAAHGWAPTLRELADRFAWSGPSAAKAHLAYLQRKGWVVVGDRMSRAIRLVGE